MTNPPRKIGFVLAATEHGTMLLDRFDHCDTKAGSFGVGHVLLDNAVYEPFEIGHAVHMLAVRRRHFGDGVLAVDCGANIGVHTLEWARSMTGWGSVIAIEAQERIFYALAGNIALNNCFNARAILAAVAATVGTMRGAVRRGVACKMEIASNGRIGSTNRRFSESYAGNAWPQTQLHQAGSG